jgi:SagB-type dehydrogenase family enzyme
MNPREELTVQLPPFHLDLAFPLARAIAMRRSHRAFATNPIAFDRLAQLLWAAQGITGPDGKRACPSAGAIYPLVTRLVAGDVGGLAPGIYRYLPESHAVRLETNGDIREELATLCVEQMWIATSPVSIILTADPDKMAKKYGSAASKFIDMEAGHVGQNVHLVAEALGLGTTMVAAFKTRSLCSLLACAPGEEPLYVMPIGEPVAGLP